MNNKLLIKSFLLLALMGAAIFVPYTLAAEDDQPIIVESINDSEIVIDVENISEGSAYYVVVNANDLSEIDKIDSDASNKITVSIENGTKFIVSGYDSSDTKLFDSKPVLVYTNPASLNNVKFQSDIYMTELSMTSGSNNLNSYKLHVFSDAIIGSNMDLAGGELYVGGNLTHSNGTLVVNKGLVDVMGNYSIVNYEDGGISYGKLKMTESEDRINVGGSFTTDSIHSHTGFLSSGVIRVKGDFNQINSTGELLDSRFNFDTSGDHKIVFCGDTTQTVFFYDPKRSQFTIWEVENTCEKPMEIPNGFGFKTLQQDSVIPCDVTIWSYLRPPGEGPAPSIDLNGHTLTIKGDLQNRRVNVRVGKGKLIIEGDYRLQRWRPVEGSEDEVSLQYTYGTLRMLYDEDYVLVMGDFYQDSYYSHSKCMIAGTLEVKGDFRQITTNVRHDTHYNFDASGTHRVILSGDGVQIVDFEDPETNQFNILEIPEDDKPGHIIMFTSEWNANEVVNNSTMTGMLNWYEEEAEDEN